MKTWTWVQNLEDKLSSLASLRKWAYNNNFIRLEKEVHKAYDTLKEIEKRSINKEYPLTG